MKSNIMVFIQEKKFAKIKYGGYVINLDKYKSVGNHWVAIYVKNDVATYFNIFGVEHIPREI